MSVNYLNLVSKSEETPDPKENCPKEHCQGELSQKKHAQETLYREWQRAVLRGNREFDNHHYCLAESSYKIGIQLAEQLLAEDETFHMPTFHIKIMTLIVSHHNLADVLLAQSFTDAATDEFLLAHSKLLTLQTQQSSMPDKLEAIMWGLRRTYTALLHHLKDNKRSKIIEVPQMPNFCSGATQHSH